MATTHTLTADHLHAISRNLFVAANTPRHIADTVAEILVNANLAGHDSHGLLRMPWYLKAISGGSIQPDKEPTVAGQTKTTLLIDGQHGLGIYTARKGLELGLEKVKESELCCVTFLNIGHIGRVGEYAEISARAGCVGTIMVGHGSSTRGGVIPFGGIAGRLGTNPIAVGIPTGDNVPFVLDFATSVVAEGKLQVAKSKNQQLPDGYILDESGVPSNNPDDFYTGGALLAFGAHKGSAFSLLTCLLSGLAGSFNPESGAVAGAYMNLMNIETFTPLGPYEKGVRKFLDGIKATPTNSEVDQVLVPGDFEHQSRTHRLEQGVEMPDPIYKQLHECAENLGISLGKGIVEPEDKVRYGL